MEMDSFDKVRGVNTGDNPEGENGGIKALLTTRKADVPTQKPAHRHAKSPTGTKDLSQSQVLKANGEPNHASDLFSVTLQEIDKEIAKFDLPTNVVG